ncbi:amidase [Hortaea werneckii]|nr:amidase [Hortaea werneckii]KAI7572532.1 amidase [Hortaea werneckii]KAI7627611.1 amidase [Hortaea werneckii]KAI7637614.1 amidase [Hortaea werneckii]KAI7683281.1 amidase [Hortaea werneckii]
MAAARPTKLSGWEAVTQQKRNDLLARIPPHWRLSERELCNAKTQTDARTVLPTFLSPVERAVTSLPAPELLRAIRTGDYTACEVAGAFGHRAVLAHQLTNCLSEIDLASAMARAQELDVYFREHGRPFGPLHGLPVSLMDRFNVEGLDSTCGFASWIGKPKKAEDEGVLLRSLRQAGALIYCKTNVPMGALMGETSNNIVGFTVNPCEGALLALGGSAVGIATDLVGSSRIPSAFTGLTALKTSEGRLSASGIETILKGLPVASGTIGIMSQDVRSVELVFKALLEDAPWRKDPDVIEMPWRPEKQYALQRRAGEPGQRLGRLVFGLLKCDGNVRPHPNIAEGLRHLEEALLEDGHEVLEWKPPPHAEAVENLLKIFGSASGPAIIQAIKASGEPPVSSMLALYDQENVTCSSAADFWEMCQKRDDYRQAYANYWAQMDSCTASGRPVDGIIIMPVAATSAAREGEFSYLAYSAIANVLDLPAFVFPVWRSGHITSPDGFNHGNLSPNDCAVSETFREGDVENMPVCLQVVCPRLQEESTLALAEAIHDTLRARA